MNIPVTSAIPAARPFRSPSARRTVARLMMPSAMMAIANISAPPRCTPRAATDTTATISGAEPRAMG